MNKVVKYNYLMYSWVKMYTYNSESHIYISLLDMILDAEVDKFHFECVDCVKPFIIGKIKIE